jgi:hypothetical protein
MMRWLSSLPAAAVALVANLSAIAGQNRMRKGERTISRRITKKNNRLWRYYKEEWQEKPLLFPKNLLLLSQNSLIFWLTHLSLAIKEGSLSG